MIARELAEWALGIKKIPDTVADAAKRHILDGLGNAVAALKASASAPAILTAQELGGPAEATIFGTDSKVSTVAAALANGTSIHALDFDDTHAGGLVHATAVVVPAAFAVAEETRASGEETLLAAVIGYETACRVAAAAPHGFHSRGLHATMVAGVFSSALVACRLYGMDLEQTVNALGIAGSQAGGLLAFLGTGASTKQLHPGFASQAGVLAARLARNGATGPETVFDGPHGVFEALANGVIHRDRILRGLGTEWETEKISIKPYPACQLSHATLDAVLDARSASNFNSGDISRIVAQVHPDSASVVCDSSRDLTRPQSEYAAKFSLPWSVAALIAEGEMSNSTFSADNLLREDIQSLAQKVVVEITDGNGVAAADAYGSVEITLDDGSSISGYVSRSAGGPENPLSAEAMNRKLSGNAGAFADQITKLVSTIEQQKDLSQLISLLAEAANNH